MSSSEQPPRRRTSNRAKTREYAESRLEELSAQVNYFRLSGLVWRTISMAVVTLAFLMPQKPGASILVSLLALFVAGMWSMERYTSSKSSQLLRFMRDSLVGDDPADALDDEYIRRRFRVDQTAINELVSMARMAEPLSWLFLSLMGVLFQNTVLPHAFLNLLGH